MTPEMLAYVAGLLEGEGSFFTVRDSRGHLRVRVSMQSTDLDVIQRLHTELGGSLSNVFQRELRKPCWGWVLQGVTAVDLMAQLVPWMGDRRRKKMLEVLRAYAQEQAS